MSALARLRQSARRTPSGAHPSVRAAASSSRHQAGQLNGETNDSERGAALVLALVVLVVGSLIVSALVIFVTADLRTLPTVRRRTNQSEALKAGIRTSINSQRDFGPTACFARTSTVTINGVAVTTTCTEGTPVIVGASLYGVVLTSQRPGSVHLAGDGAGVALPITGPVFLNGGALSPLTNDIALSAELTLSSATSPTALAARYSAPGDPTPMACDDPGRSPSLVATDQFAQPGGHAVRCQVAPWWAVVNDASGRPGFPALPPMPTSARTDVPFAYGATGCKVFYPGRYIGSAPLILNSGNYYFASGVYYFEHPIQITNGAKVIIGSGPISDRGCVTDAVAKAMPGAPANGEISGRGATLIFGAAGALSVQGDGTRLVINRRIASSSNTASEGASIRFVSTGVASSDVDIPEDVVRLPDGSTVPVTGYSIPPVKKKDPAIQYLGSTLVHDDIALGVQTGNATSVTIGGTVHAPQARVVLAGAGASPIIRLRGGVVATELLATLTGTPAVGAWLVGSTPNVVQRQFTLTAVGTVGGRERRSVAVFELNKAGAYALNSWTLDA
jgi:hypothetical protein